MSLRIVLNLANQISHHPAPSSQSRSVVQQQLSNVCGPARLVVDCELGDEGFIGFLLLMQLLDGGRRSHNFWLVNPQIFPSGLQVNEQGKLNRLLEWKMLKGGF